MAILDDPKARILQLFALEEREGRGKDCQRFEAGAHPPELPLDEGELVYGVFKDKYFFTPQSFIQESADGFVRIRWDEIRSCSTKHGEGKQVADLVLVNGITIQVRVGDFAKGWGGRISQLFHQLIERHGASATFGPRLYSVGEFFVASSDPAQFLPNLDPPLSREHARNLLHQLEQLPGVRKVFLDISDFDGDSPVANAVVVCGNVSADSLSNFAAEFHADGVLEASDDIRRKVGPVPNTERVWHVVWD